VTVIGGEKESFYLLIKNINKENFKVTVLYVEKSETQKKDALIVGVIGIFDECKGQHYLLQAIAELVKQRVQAFSVLVVGNRREEETLRSFVREQKLRNYVIFLGYRKNVASFLQTIDLLVVPSLKDSFPRVVLEAMALTVPVIATSVGGFPELIQQGLNGLLVPPVDHCALARALDYMLKNTQMKTIMGEAGRKKLRNNLRLRKIFQRQNINTKNK
jgi:L-malate glycosyltransferase